MPRSFELELALLEIAPRIWRRVRVPGDLTLAELHRVIQAVIPWEDAHLHLFEVDGREYAPEPEEESERERWAGEDRDMTVAQALADGNHRFEYVYDFGDEWHVEVRSSADGVAPATSRIECLAGELAGPPEDSGGPNAYRELLDAWRSTGRPGLSQEFRERLPEGFDPFDFDLHAANLRLAEEFRGQRSAGPPPAGAEDQLRADLALLLLYLGSWEERGGARVAWKTIRFEAIDALADAGLLVTNPHRKSVVLTEDGLRRAEALLQRVTPLLKDVPSS